MCVVAGDVGHNLPLIELPIVANSNRSVIVEPRVAINKAKTFSFCGQARGRRLAGGRVCAKFDLH